MRFKPTPELCYLAGLAAKSGETERSAVGIRTQNDEIEERFIKYALALGVDTKKIIIEEQDSFRHVYFYHSKLSRMIRDVMKERTTLPRKKGDLAVSFVAGMFDANGHVFSTGITIRKLDRSDELVLELLGIHTVGGRILNIRDFVKLLGKRSLLIPSAAL
ncbi:MAG: hypothetical protein KGI04_04585 [Candidatus Micrarchaeota archaeon]|nr:hypothetical protein [Candidatus Micrarchaeota archaeon]